MARRGAAAVLMTFAAEGFAADFMIPIEVPDAINMAGVAVGSYPDYIGSDDTAVGVAPYLRWDLGSNRYVQLLANDLRVNLLDHDKWRAGPMMIYRFGRSDVDDKLVARLGDLDDTVELGGFVAYRVQLSADPRHRIGAQAYATADVGGEHDGYVAGIGVNGFQPLSRAFTLGYGAATTYGDSSYTDHYFGVTPRGSLASGLPTFEAGGGMRDARGFLTGILSLSPQWHLGAGVMYQKLLGDAAGSGVTSVRGDENQWVYGAGAMYAW
jgi:outer membrane protein